jgi:hypothetical protein
MEMRSLRKHEQLAGRLGEDEKMSQQKERRERRKQERRV